MEKRPLHTYLADHLAGARYAVELLERCRDSYPELGEFFDVLVQEVEEDRLILRSMLLRIGGSESGLKDLGARVFEQISRLKNREPSESKGLSLLERLEILSLGVMGKRSLWKALSIGSGPGGRFGGVSLDELLRRADDQHARIEGQRLRCAEDLFLDRVEDHPPDRDDGGFPAASSRSADSDPSRYRAEQGEDATLRAVLLDVDGTLIETNDAHARAWFEAFAEAGLTIPVERVRPLIGMGGDKLMPALTDLDPGSEEGQAVSRRQGELFLERHLEGCRPFAEVRALLERFRGDGLELAVVTSASDEQMDRILEAAGVDDLIDRSTSASDVKDSKPDPDAVQTALDEIGCKPREALLLGDTPFDVGAATSAGVGVVALLCGGSGSAELAGALAVYASPSHLISTYERSPFSIQPSRV